VEGCIRRLSPRDLMNSPPTRLAAFIEAHAVMEREKGLYPNGAAQEDSEAISDFRGSRVDTLAFFQLVRAISSETLSRFLRRQFGRSGTEIGQHLLRKINLKSKCHAIGEFPTAIRPLDPEKLARGFSLEMHSLLQREVEFNGSGIQARAFVHTASTVPAFVRMQGNRGLSLYRIRDIYIHLAYVYTRITTNTGFRISNHRPVRRNYIGHDVYLSALSALQNTAGAFNRNSSFSSNSSDRTRLQKISAFHCPAFLLSPHILSKIYQFALVAPVRHQSREPDVGYGYMEGGAVGLGFRIQDLSAYVPI
jgi:hypothetical protein